MPDLGIGEAIAALTGGEFLGGLGSLLGIGGGEAAAGAGIGEAAAGLGAAGIGEAALGPTALGTAEAFMAPAEAAGLSALGPTALGTAEAFMAAPEASLLGLGAGGGLLGAAGAEGASPTTLGGVASTGAGGGATGGSGAGASVFETGAAPVSNIGGSGAAGVAAPPGITAAPDPTALGGATSTAGTGTGAAAPANSSSISEMLSKAGSGALKSLTSNPLGIALGAGGLGYNIYSGMQQSANQKALSGSAATAAANSSKMEASGEALQQYLTNGTLPPAYQEQVDEAIKAAKTKAISNAAAQGLPTDPTQNTALATTLAGIDNSRASMQTQVASQLFQSGQGLVNSAMGAAGLSGQLYQTLVSNETASAANTGKAIATLAAALNNKTNANIGGTNIQVSAA